MTPDIAPVARRCQDRLLRAAARFRPRAARGEAAAHRQQAKVRRLAGDLRQPRALVSQAWHGVQQAAQFFSGGRFRFLAIAPIFAFAFFFAKGVVRERALFFQLSPVGACRSLYGFDPFPESITVADYIRTHSPPTAQIAVLGSEPEIYFYAHRRAATGYIYAYPLLERQPFARQMRQEMLQEITAARPQFLVQVRTWTSWLPRPGSPTVIANTCNALTPPDYELVGSADFIAEESRFKWRWGVDASNRPTNASFNLLIFQLQPPAANLY